MEDWKDFVQSFAERYKGKIQIYEIWNEPNISREWGNVKPDAKAYTSSVARTKDFVSSRTSGSDQTDCRPITPLFHVHPRGFPFIV